MDAIVAPPEHPHFTRQPTDCDQALQLNGGILPGNREDEVDRYFTRQPTDCDQALQPNSGILPGNRQTDGILPGNREDEVEENYDWCEGYFMVRNTEPEKDPIVVLPIKERRRRSLIEIAEACENSRPLARFSNLTPFRPSHPFARFSISRPLGQVFPTEIQFWIWSNLASPN